MSCDVASVLKFPRSACRLHLRHDIFAPNVVAVGQEMPEIQGKISMTLGCEVNAVALHFKLTGDCTRMPMTRSTQCWRAGLLRKGSWNIAV